MYTIQVKMTKNNIGFELSGVDFDIETLAQALKLIMPPEPPTLKSNKSLFYLSLRDRIVLI